MYRDRQKWLIIERETHNVVTCTPQKSSQPHIMCTSGPGIKYCWLAEQGGGVSGVPNLRLELKQRTKQWSRSKCQKISVFLFQKSRISSSVHLYYINFVIQRDFFGEQINVHKTLPPYLLITNNFGKSEMVGPWFQTEVHKSKLLISSQWQSILHAEITAVLAAQTS